MLQVLQVVAMVFSVFAHNLELIEASETAKRIKMVTNLDTFFKIFVPSTVLRNFFVFNTRNQKWMIAALSQLHFDVHQFWKIALVTALKQTQT